MHDHLWTAVNKSVEQLSTTQAAVIGGVGSSASAVSVMAVDGETWLQLFTIACGAVGALLSLGLLLLKFVQQRREMTKWRTDNETEHDTMFVQHAESAIDRSELHTEINVIAKESEQLQHDLANLRRRCDKCGHLRSEGDER